MRESRTAQSVKVFVSHCALIFVFMVCGLCVSHQARAQQGGEGTEIQLFVGDMLPNQIDGVTDILPIFGARYGLGTSFGTVEGGFMNSHASGVDFTTLELSLRGDVPAGDGLVGSIYAGGDFNYYTEKNSTNRQSVDGLHIGVAGQFMVSNTLWLRSDLKFMGGPGTSLYLLFGLVFRDP